MVDFFVVYFWGEMILFENVERYIEDGDLVYKVLEGIKDIIRVIFGDIYL